MSEEKQRRVSYCGYSQHVQPFLESLSSLLRRICLFAKTTKLASGSASPLSRRLSAHGSDDPRYPLNSLKPPSRLPLSFFNDRPW
ncbi:hypothetical protein J6590_043305 [Homalodisca vitripennis]|nr:hypothetical protein J6590_043305 [Homalodisca vitripennis]